MISNVIYCEFKKVGNACRNQLKYKGKKEVCGPDRALFEKGLRPFYCIRQPISRCPDRALFEKGLRPGSRAT